MSELNFRQPAIVPVPADLTYDAHRPVRLTDGLPVAVTCPDRFAVTWACDHLRTWLGFAPKVSFREAIPLGVRTGEGYVLSVRPEGLSIGANALAGVRHAVMTLRQAAERESVGTTLRGYWMPAMEVKDCPSLGFRGVHFCWLPELNPSFIEHQIRLAAYYKFNFAVIESWGVFKSERHPELSIPNAPLTTAEAHRLAALAKDLGLTLIPQVNIFGHASMARSMGGKHVTLDFHPEMQPLFEPAGGWNWCLSNPEARAVVRDLVSEIHAAFDNPPFFHIGCDEADPPSCPECRSARPYAKLVETHITEVAAMLRARGARAMMWHDMLLEKGDRRWFGPNGKPLFYANGSADEAKMASTLPRDIVICDWYYGSNYGRQADPGAYPTLDYFKGLGYSTLTCPWDDIKAIGVQGGYARREHLFGILQTVWHHFRGLKFGEMMQAAANAGWAGKSLPAAAWTTPMPVVTHWRQVGWDMGIKTLAETGFYDTTVTREALDR